MDWSLGRYERVALQLRPAAAAVVDAAAPGPGERVLDLGCGTGNAALEAAQRGAAVTGIDPAPRLLEVAREQATALNLDIGFRTGDAAAIPVADGSADVLVSVFGVIFAPDASSAAVEMARVLTPQGRLALSAWLPGGALADMMNLRAEAVSAATETTAASRAPTPAAAPVARRFAWHDAGALATLFGGFGFEIDVVEHGLLFTADSPLDFLDGEIRDHPAWVAVRGGLEARGALTDLHERLLAVLEAANEDPTGFRVTSRYVVVSGRRG
jgi:SAM-dependent methyltransferase